MGFDIDILFRLGIVIFFIILIALEYIEMNQRYKDRVKQKITDNMFKMGF